MAVVFCTTCKGRTEHLSRTLPQNLKDNPSYRFVLLDYNDQDSLADYVKEFHSTSLDSGRLVFFQYQEQVPFRMAHAKNMAHRLGIAEGGDILVNLDADNFTGKGFGDYITEEFRDRKGIFLWSRMIKEGEGRLPRGISGRIAVTDDDFILVGGYDEKYTMYSPDDKDFNARLRRLGLDGREIDPKFLSAILHNDKMRYREYPKAVAITEDFVIQHDYTVVNSGNIGTGNVLRNFTDWMEVEPIATRVFGIGMHKTATGSLHHALEILGFKSWHWSTAHVAKRIWREMNQLGRSPELEQYYCACDLPIPLLYRKLDLAYPGSKFILTVRDEHKWLASVKKHFDPMQNKYRHQWDTDPFSNRIHQILYGRMDFEPSTFMARYRRHNAEVKEYFKDRPGDLLVMDMDNGAGWEELCDFLHLRHPTVKYPTIIST